jgi:predicted DNA-binding transcriptional regulator YafY
MSQFKSVERLSFILSYVNDHHFPSKEDIMAYLEAKDMFPTERTFQRDLKTLRDMCFIEVKYNRTHNGYHINEESKPDFDNWMHVFELFNTARVINETLAKSSGNIDYIDFDRTTMRMDPEILKGLLQAVIDRNVVKFTHHSFWSAIDRPMAIMPHLLKQYQNRWYVYGCFPNGEFRSFGIDRISDLEILSESFKPKMKRPKEMFDNIIGLVYEAEKVEEVVLSYEAFQGNYIKTQPIHTSQKILVDNDVELRISIRVIPNYELEEQILKQGERVKVMEPQWLRDSILERLKKAIGQY